MAIFSMFVNQSINAKTMFVIIAAMLINWAMFFFFLKDRKFYPAMYKFYWTLAIIFIPFSWILFLVWGLKAHSLQDE